MTGAGEMIEMAEKGSSNDANEHDEDSTSKPISNSKKLTIIALVLPNFVISASYSVIEPFFPTEHLPATLVFFMIILLPFYTFPLRKPSAYKSDPISNHLKNFDVLTHTAGRKGVGPVTTGIIFAVYGLILFIGCPLSGKYLPKFGVRTMYLAGMSTCGICTQMFGILVRIPNTMLFIALSFILRCFEAIGHAVWETALFTTCAQTYPDRVAYIIGLSEKFNGIGYAAGPAIGGFLYEIGGYELPFLVLGVSVVLCVLVSLFILPKHAAVSAQQHSGSILVVLSAWFLWPIIGTLVIGAICCSFLEPTFAIHLEQFHLSPLHIGLYYFAELTIYAVGTPVVGFFIDKTAMERATILLGLCFVGVGFLFLGPAPSLRLPNELWIIFIGSAFLQFGWSASLLSPFQDLLSTAKRHGIPATIQVQGVISGIFSGCYALGLVIGPAVSGFMVSTVGFQKSCTIFSLVHFFLVIFLGLFTIFDKRYIKRYEKKQHDKGGKYQPLSLN